jgi:tryptophan synthase alpha chain
MNRIKQLFEHKENNVLSIYFTAGYPDREDTANIISALSDAGADIIEIGIPFSDPVADGPIIQNSNDAALHNGMTLSILFKQLEQIREKTEMPLILMGYLNPIIQFGIEAFLERANKCGIDGVIVPDLPIDEYQKHYRSLFDHYNLKMIFLITPQTSADRIRIIDELSDAFIYMVTASKTTGTISEIATEQLSYFSSIQKLKLHNPVLAGFGIHDKKSFDTVCHYVNGAIVGSNFIKALAEKRESGGLQNTIHHFIKKFRP